MPAIPRTTNPSAVPGFRKRLTGSAGTSASSAFEPSSEVGIYLSDGDAELNLIGTPPDGIWLQPKGFTWPVPEIENVYAQSDTSEYRSRIRTRPLNPDGNEVRLFVGASTETDFWNYLDTLQALVASTHRKKGTLRIVPPRNGEPVTFDIESIRLKDLPDDGVELKQLLVEATLEYEVRPYGKLEERDLVVGKTLTGPVDWMLVEDVPGHVNALGQLVLRETANQAIRHLEVGVQEEFDPDSPEPLTVGVEQMTLGFQGIRTTISGGVYSDGVRATLTTTPAVVCSTGRLPHKGRWRVRARVSVSATTVWVRLTWRVGDGPLASESWVEVPDTSSFYDLELAVLNIPEVPSGEHSWEGRIEAYASDVGTTIDLDTISPFPADVYGRATTTQATATATSLVEDLFGQSAGDLEGKSPTYPATAAYVQVGDSNDFVVDGSGNLERTATGDSSGIGCGELLFLPHTNVNLWFEFYVSSGGGGNPLFGAYARYVDASNYALVCIQPHAFAGGAIDGFDLKIIKRTTALGARTTIDSASFPDDQIAAFTLVGISIDDIGRYAVHLSPYSSLTGGGTPILSGIDSDLAAGGSLGNGLAIGLYDEYTSGTACTRKFNYWGASSTPSQAPVSYPSGSVELRSDSVLRESDDGTFMGSVPAFTGKYLTLPPSTDAGLKSRVVIKRRRYNVDAGLPDSGLTDTATADLSATGRVTTLSKQVD